MKCVLRCGGTDGSGSETGTAEVPAEIHIEARKLADGRVEFRLDVDGVKWLPPARFLPYDRAPTGRWLRSSPYVVDKTSGPSVESETARRRCRLPW